MMDRFYILTNSEKDQNLEVTGTIREFLEARGKTCTVRTNRFRTGEQIPDDIDCMVVLGGDGTMIQAAGNVVEQGIPLLGVNLGTLGYLAEVERRSVIPALEQLLSGAYEIEERMMLRGTVYHGKEGIASKRALNDIVINRTGTLRILNYHIYVNGSYLNSYSADGIIVSTPTGSTGYSLSAGGPIVDPKASLIMITPICPHTLNTRSIILSGEDEITIELGPGRKKNEEEAETAFDGEGAIRVVTGDRIVIRKARLRTRIVKLSRRSFLEVLRRKMGSGREQTS